MDQPTAVIGTVRTVIICPGSRPVVVQIGDWDGDVPKWDWREHEFVIGEQTTVLVNGNAVSRLEFVRLMTAAPEGVSVQAALYLSSGDVLSKAEFLVEPKAS